MSLRFVNQIKTYTVEEVRVIKPDIIVAEKPIVIKPATQDNIKNASFDKIDNTQMIKQIIFAIQELSQKIDNIESKLNESTLFQDKQFTAIGLLSDEVNKLKVVSETGFFIVTE